MMSGDRANLIVATLGSPQSERINDAREHEVGLPIELWEKIIQLSVFFFSFHIIFFVSSIYS